MLPWHSLPFRRSRPALTACGPPGKRGRARGPASAAPGSRAFDNRRGSLRKPSCWRKMLLHREAEFLCLCKAGRPEKGACNVRDAEQPRQTAVARSRRHQRTPAGPLPKGLAAYRALRRQPAAQPGARAGRGGRAAIFPEACVERHARSDHPHTRSGGRRGTALDPRFRRPRSAGAIRRHRSPCLGLDARQDRNARPDRLRPRSGRGARRRGRACGDARRERAGSTRSACRVS